MAHQTFEIFNHYASVLHAQGMPLVRAGLCIGGMAIKEQVDAVKRFVTEVKRRAVETDTFVKI